MSRNIKEIGKELLGKSLNSYHRRTGLTQLEENNKMQDGILNGILSQVDDAYIEKTEQSNVIHLDGSGDGTVVVDGIEGNTMVNIVKSYNTNDFVYLNSVMQSDGYFKLQYGKNVNTSFVRPKLGVHTYKPNTKYTVVVDIKENTCDKQLGMSAIHSAIETLTPRDFPNKLGISTSVITTRNDINIDNKGEPTRYDLYFGIWEEDGGDLSKHITFKYWVLEGDWTNRELPPYFEGLQSSFEEKVNDEGKYEIEILMKNKNLLDINNMEKNIIQSTNTAKIKVENNVIKFNNDSNARIRCFYKVKVKPNTIYSFTSTISRGMVTIYKGKSDNNSFHWSDDYLHGYKNYTPYDNNLCKIQFTTDDNEKHIYIRFSNEGVESNSIFSLPILQKGENITDYVSYKQNKIKLLINEPLRSMDNIKDILCEKDGKLVVKRNYGELALNNNSNIEMWNSRGDCIDFRIAVQDIKHSCKMLSDKFTYLSWNTNDVECCTVGASSHIYVRILKSKLSEVTVQGFKTWLQTNPVKIVYELKDPVYEEVLNEYGEPIMLEGYENGTVYIDSVITPTATLRYTPKMESLKTLKAVNHNNIMLTDDINNNIIDYMMNVDLMIMEKEMQITKTRRIGEKDMTNMQKRTFDMLKRLIKGKTLTEQECKDRVVLYLSAEKITSEQAEELMLYISEIYA